MKETVAVVPTFIRNKIELDVTEKAINTLRETSNAFVCVVDDGSPFDGVHEAFEALGVDKLVLKEKNEGFSHTVNHGLRFALENKTDAVLVNADMEFTNDEWLPAMEANEAGVVGALLTYPNNIIQHAGVYFSVIYRSFDHILRFAPANISEAQKPRICPVTGALQLIKYDTLKTVGLYDETFRLGWEDVAYCHDVFMAGEKCAYEPKATAIHHESLFRGKNPSKQILEWQRQSWDRLHERFAGHDFSEYVPTLLNWHD